MSEPSLCLSEDLVLPLDAITQTFAILAKRGSGKTYCALVMAEEMLKQGLPFVFVDPVGVCWGLRASADGQGDGLPIIVLGGEHGDLEIEPSDGSVIADFVVSQRQSVVLDLSSFSGNQMTQFVTEFAEVLYQKNRLPLHLFLDESDAFAPQKPLPGEQRMLGAIDKLVRRGRAKGLGVTLITQRPAVIHKNVLTQVEVLITLRLVSPQDRKAIESWIEVHGTPEQRDELMRSLPSLPIGTAWIWSPGWLDVFQQVQVRRRDTFDSSITPTLEAQLIIPKKLAEVDLAGLKQSLSLKRLSQAKGEGSREVASLKRRIAELEQRLQQQSMKVEAEPVVEQVEVPLLSKEQIVQLEVAVNALIEVGDRLSELGKEIKDLLQAATVECAAAGETRVPIGKALAEVEKVAQLREGQIGRQITLTQGQRHHSVQLKAGEHKMVAVLAACYPIQLSRTQLGTLSGFSPTGGTFSNYLSTLKRNGLIEESNKRLEITSAGWQWLGAEPTEITTSQWLSMWREVLKTGERKMLEALVNAYPEMLTRLEIGQQTGYESTGGTFSNYLSTLRRNELVVEVRGSVFRANSKLISSS